MTKTYAQILVSIITLLSISAVAADLDPRLDPGPTAVVVEIVDGDTVILDDGSQVRLVGIQTPKLPLGRVGFAEQPLAQDAKAALESLVLNRTVTLGFDGTDRDRHGRWLAHLYRDDGLWIQGRMVDLALARVYSFPDNRTLAADLLLREEAARRLDAGIWALPFYRIRDAQQPDTIPLDSYELVEGRVQETGEFDRRIFLNFGEDWKTDLTATVSPQDNRLFEAEAIDLQDLAGHRIRVRGWVTWRNGPSINVSHPEQIEVLD